MMNENKQKALSSVAEIKDRCVKRLTKIKTVANTTSTRGEVFILIFEDGSQANVNYATLESLHIDAHGLWTKEHYKELV